jgi:hypothetical protein
VQPSLRFDYKHTRVKQYFKLGRALRTEGSGSLGFILLVLPFRKSFAPPYSPSSASRLSHRRRRAVPRELTAAGSVTCPRFVRGHARCARITGTGALGSHRRRSARFQAFAASGSRLGSRSGPRVPAPSRSVLLVLPFRKSFVHNCTREQRLSRLPSRATVRPCDPGRLTNSPSRAYHRGVELGGRARCGRNEQR